MQTAYFRVRGVIRAKVTRGKKNPITARKKMCPTLSKADIP